VKRALPLVLLCACATTAPPPRTGKALTVERIYSEPGLGGTLPGQVQWSPDSRFVTYLHGSALTAFEWETKKREKWLDNVASYSWSGGLMLVRRGDDLIVYDPAKRALVGTPLPARRMQDARLSPDGRYVSFVRAHDLWAQPVGGGAEIRLTTGGSDTLLNGELDWVYPEELGIKSGYAWAPDSSRVAFLQLDESKVTRFPLVDWRPVQGRVEPMFYPKAGEANPAARVGVAALDGRVEWQALPDGTEYVARLAWTPGGELVLHTLNRQQDALAISIGGKVVRTDKSATWVDVNDDLRFLRDGRMLWTSEQTGRNHIVLDGKALTQGDWDVAGIAGVDEAAGAVLYAGSEGNHLERHVWRVTFDGKRERLTRERGWHSPVASPDGTKFVDTWSSVDRPPRLDPIEENRVAELDDYGFDAPRFERAAGLDALVFRPRTAGPVPVIVHVYGGPGAQSVADRWNGRSYLWHQLMVQRGFAVVILDNRCSGARGPQTVREMHRRLGEIEVADLGAGVAWIMKQPWCDAKRIGLWGWSYGGYMTCLAMTKLDVFRAGVAVAPVTHWQDYDTIYTERYMLRPQDNADGYRDSAPVTHAAKLHGRLLLVHGLADDNVHFQNAVHFVDELVKARKPFDQLVYPGRNHGIGDREARIHLFTAMQDFFERELRR